MGGRFGKYGDAKRKAKIRKTRLTPPVSRPQGKGKPLRESRKGKRGSSDPQGER